MSHHRHLQTVALVTCTAVVPFRVVDRDRGVESVGVIFPSKFPETRTLAAAAVLLASAVAVRSPEVVAAGPDTAAEVLASSTDRCCRPCPVLILAFVLWVEKNPGTPRAAATAVGHHHHHPCGLATSPLAAVVAPVDSVPEEVAPAADEALLASAAEADRDSRIVVVAQAVALRNILLAPCAVAQEVVVVRHRNAAVGGSAAVAEASAAALVRVHRPVSGAYLFSPPVQEMSWQPWLCSRLLPVRYY